MTASGSLAFSYNASGSRYRTADSSSGTTVYNYYLSPYEEIRNGVKTYYIFAGSQRVASLEGTVYTYYHNDHLGGTALTSDSVGAVSQVYDYYPYGSELINEQIGSSEVHHSFTDKELEDALGLYYFEARWYDGEIGRFASIDPMQLSSPEKYINDPQQFNNYSYARNNPINLIDPFGLEATIITRYGEGYGDYGHSAIEINGTVYEYYQTTPSTITQMITGVDGQVDVDTGGISEFYGEAYADDGKNNLFQTTTIETTDEQNQSIVDHFVNLAENTSDYKLFSNNCTTVIVDALENAGVADFYDGVEWNSENPWDVTYHNDPITPAGLAGELNTMNESGDVQVTDNQYYSE